MKQFIIETLARSQVVELLFIFSLILVSFLLRRPFSKISLDIPLRWFPFIVRYPFIIFILIGLIAFVASAVPSVLTEIPQPHIHDEFSYLLAADTFSQGRLANPPHPLWKHFETIHVLQQPTYASKYFPAQGMILAFGQMFFGHPIVGVWLSVGFACAAISWMLAGWTTLRWAWLGGLIAIIRLVFSGGQNWSQNYWGGAVAALGGALFLGAFPRIMKTRRSKDALFLALGMAILATSRPFEGLMVSIPVITTLVIWITRNRLFYSVQFWGQIFLPVFLILGLTASWMALYNYRVTGNPFLLPHLLYEDTYGVAPEFLWRPLKPEPNYNHQFLRNFHAGWHLRQYQRQKSLSGWLHKVIYDFKNLWLNYIGIFFTPLILVLAFIWRRRNIKFVLIVCAFMMIALSSTTFHQKHYAAPITCLIIFLVLECLRKIRTFKWQDKLVGQSFAKWQFQ